MDIITLSNFRYRIGTSSTNKHFRMLLLDLMRIFGSTMDAIRNSKIFRLSSTFLSLLNSWGNWVLTLIITFKLWMMCGCVRVIKLVCVWQMEFRTKWHYTKNAIILTTMKSIISNLLPSSMQCNMRLVYHALKIKANSSKMSFLPHGSSNKDPSARMEKWFWTFAVYISF